MPENKKKTLRYEGDGDNSCDWRAWNELKMHGKGSFWDWPEFWEEPLRPEETFCHSDSRESLAAKDGVKNSHGVQ